MQTVLTNRNTVALYTKITIIQSFNLNKNIVIIIPFDFNKAVYMNGGCKIIVI